MNAFIFVGIMCIGQNCTFLSSMNTLTQKECEEIKSEFLQSPFRPEVTLAAAQCMKFKPKGVQV